VDLPLQSFIFPIPAFKVPTKRVLALNDVPLQEPLILINHALKRWTSFGYSILVVLG
jgi:hypothetical protein